MTSLNSMTLLFISMLSLSFLSRTTTHAADPVHLKEVCANTTFSPNSIYQSNLNSLLSSLSSNVTQNLEFYNTTSGQNTPNPVYGLFLCRGDVTPQLCQECVAAAVKEVTKKCSREKVAVIWYDECMIRYSNRSFFSTVDEKPRLALLNTQNITEQDKFNKLLAKSMNETAAQASNAPIGAKKYGTKEVNISAFQTLYNLVQCTADLSRNDCSTCLQAAIKLLPWCCSGKQGGRVIFPSCSVRYELYPFYRMEIATLPPAPIHPSSYTGKKKISTATIIAIVVPIVALVLVILSFCFLTMRARKKSNAIKGENFKKSDQILNYQAASELPTVDSCLQFDFGTIEAATNKFSDDKKIGEGGFGKVYKGTLPSGQVIAVKRLGKSSGQGVEQFKNEVELQAKLQHKNLAGVLGFCLKGEEKILIYEFVPNRSLDNFIYDSKKQGQLDWAARYKIIGGIARGIQYLHKDSQLRIIHRDLKASSILLDADMNPKISDFGIARILEVDQTQKNASRIVGTYGYMSPEYAMQGEFSEKSDVYSFGVLVLEIITGKKNSNFESEGAADLLSYAWIHWRDGRPLELLDPTLKGFYLIDEAIKCIHVGLLCVQKDPADRPSMASIVLTLSSHSVSLPTPLQPAFFLRNTDQNLPQMYMESDQSTSMSMSWSINDESVTEPHAR
ncbi:cysteine-rich receptor-like protein kinase 25 isoform X1 [Quercus robur]|uniref:cysteine-rich receptor-like protein kinase 25 isoform X1 n=1 Tax=Quercus robur TaxID=38942 RepID=UPI0021621758|nr:cysteine-rich receptor-like protein kinase 25 isoform X1 [Quercus robur]